jgi:antitoxin FitA
MLTVELKEETQRALEKRAAKSGHAVEDEARAILEAAVRAERTRPMISPEVGLGTLLQEFGRKYGPLPEVERDRTPAEPVSFD